MICACLRLVTAKCLHDVSDLLAIAVIRAGDGAMMRDGDQPRAEVHEREHHALRLLGDGLQSP